MYSGLANAPDPQTVLNWSKHYAFNLGWVIIPIHRIVGFEHNGEEVCSCEVSTGTKWKNCSGKAGKHPWSKWGEIKTPQQGFDAFMRVFNENPLGVNIGIRTGAESGIWAVDIDMGPDKDGVASLEEWFAANKLSFVEVNKIAVVAMTGGGGWHLIFEYPPDGKIPTVAPHKEMGPHVDIKGHGGYIIAQPSIHRADKQYAFFDAPVSKDDIKAAPAIMVEAVRKQQRTHSASVSTHTPDRIELSLFADELASKRTSETMKKAGEDMQQALRGNAIADEGGGHDAYRNIMFFIARKWKGCDAEGVVAYFEDSVEARFAYKADASTDIDNLVDAMQSALNKNEDEEGNNWAAQVMINSEGRVTANDANMLLFFRNHPSWKGVFGYDTRLGKPVYLKPPPLVRASAELDMTSDKSETALWFQTRGDMSGRFASTDMQSAVLAASKDNQFDPIVDMLNQVRGTWDGVPRLSTLMQRVAGSPDTQWTRGIMRMWFIGVVARSLEPGCKVDTMLILEGSQGFKKSTFFSSLLPDSRYFSDGLTKVKHDVETLRLIHGGPLIFEIGELGNMGKQAVEDTKAFLSAREDQLRPLYEAPRQAKRRCIFVGSTNMNEYLRDSTGGRRFWPIEVTRTIDIYTVIEERAQLFAEGLVAYGDGTGGVNGGQGERWWLETADEISLARDEQDKRYEDDIWAPKVWSWLAKKVVQEPPGGAVTATDQMQQDVGNKKLAGEYVTVTEVAENALELEMKNARGGEAKRIEAILRREGWLPARHYIDGKQRRAWKRPISESM